MAHTTTYSRRSVGAMAAAAVLGVAAPAAIAPQIAEARTATTAANTRGLSRNGVKVINAIHKKFPKIKRILTLRRSNDDHGSGHAVDLMIPRYSSSSGKLLGNQVASYLRKNAKTLGITYIIWRQHIWSVGRAGEGWRRMSSRGSATANHMDHVHVSVR